MSLFSQLKELTRPLWQPFVGSNEINKPQPEQQVSQLPVSQPQVSQTQPAQKAPDFYTERAVILPEKPPVLEKPVFQNPPVVKNNAVELNSLQEGLGQLGKSIGELSIKLNEYFKKAKESLPPTAPTIPTKEAVLGEQAKDVSLEKWNELVNKYDIPNRIAEIEKIRKNIFATSEAFDQLFNELNNEAGVPQSVKEKRMAYLNNQREKNLKTLELQYNFLVDNYKNALEQAKTELGLFEKSEEQKRLEREREKDNSRQLIQQMISTGGIGELDDQELKDWADKSGYTFESLRAVRRAVKTGNDLKVQKALEQLQNQAERLDLERQRFDLSRALKSETGASYHTRLNQEVNNVYSGRYGTEGARERAIQILKSEFPGIDVAKDIYNRITDEWEKTAKFSSKTSRVNDVLSFEEL